MGTYTDSVQIHHTCTNTVQGLVQPTQVHTECVHTPPVCTKPAQSTVEHCTNKSSTRKYILLGTPVLKYHIKDGCRYRPLYSQQEAAVQLPIQEQLNLLPNEIKIVDLGIKVLVPPNFCALLEGDKYKEMTNGLQVYVDLINVGYRSYLNIAVQNMCTENIQLPAGTPLCTLRLVQSTVPTQDVSPTSDFTTDVVKCEPLELSAPLSEVHTVLDTLNPTQFGIGLLNINLIGTDADKIQQINHLLEFEITQLQGSSVTIASMLPVLNADALNPTVDGKSIPLRKAEHWKNPDGSCPDLNKSEMAALLAADLADDFKLSVKTLTELQNAEPVLRSIKDALVGNSQEYKYFVLKKGLLCREYSTKNDTMQTLGVYIPTCILYAVVIYVHKHFMHPSRTQTLKEFSALYYHPFAKKAVQKVCDACLVCKQSRNPETRKLHVGRQRTLKPTKPREAVSIDVLYFPTSSKGHRYGLIVADLYSLYISFYPMKTKNSAEVAKNLRTYFSSQCPPSTVYSDNDPSFRGEVETLFRTYKVKHMTSYPFAQRQNYVESQVRIFKNAYRAAILDSSVFKTKDWDTLYPLVVCRINCMISKYGMSREAMHYGHVVESSLPLITDAEIFEPLESHVDEIAKRFRERMGKFMQKRQRNKTYYKVGKKYNFYINELVMYKVYKPESLLHPTYSGPARIIDLQELGATLRDPRTGTQFSVTFENLRKINFEELLALLPQNFDSEIAASLGQYRYRQSGKEAEEPAPRPAPGKEPAGEPFINPDVDEEETVRRTRSGKVYNIDVNRLPEKYRNRVSVCTLRPVCIPRMAPPSSERPPVPCLKRKPVADRITHLEAPPLWKNGMYIYALNLKESSIRKISRYKESAEKCTLLSEKSCTVRMTNRTEPRPGRVKFGPTTIFFI